MNPVDISTLIAAEHERALREQDAERLWAGGASTDEIAAAAGVSVDDLGSLMLRWYRNLHDT